MILVIDIGNTNTAFALHDGQQWVSHWRSATDATRTADDYAVWLGTLLAGDGKKLSDISACVVSSVVPQAKFNFRNLSRRYFETEPMFIGDPGVELGVPVRIARPEQAGADRLVAAIGAHTLYQGALLVIDSGTATTFDVVGPDGGFEGGIIAQMENVDEGIDKFIDSECRVEDDKTDNRKCLSQRKQWRSIVSTLLTRER